jgi:hypothetical protein
MKTTHEIECDCNSSAPSYSLRSWLCDACTKTGRLTTQYGATYLAHQQRSEL